MSKFDLIVGKELYVSFTAETGETEQHNVTTLPAQDSLVVQHVRNQLLGQLSMERMFQKLSTTASMFLITYLAVDGIENMQSAVYTLRDSFINTMRISANKNMEFRMLSKTAASDLVYGFHALIDGAGRPKGEEADQAEDFLEAQETFAAVAKSARKIADGANELVEKYVALQTESRGINTDIMNSRALSIEEKAKVEATIKLTEAMAKGLEAAQKSLQDEIDELMQEYEKVSRNLDKAENRAFKMAIVSAVTNVVTAGIQGYISTTPGGIANNIAGTVVGGKENTPEEGSTTPSAEPTAPAATPGTTSVETQRKVDEGEAQLAATNQRIQEIDAEMAAIDEQIKSETDETKREELKASKQTLADQKTAQNENAAVTRSSVEQNRAIMNGLASAMEQASAATGQLAQDQKDTVGRLSARLDRISSQRSALNRQKREMIMQAAEYAAIIESSVVTKDELQLAVKALSVAIMAMSFIISTLNDYAAFWERIAVFTEDLAGDELNKLTSRLKRTKAFNVQFLQTVLLNASSWIVLHNIFGEYEKRFLLVYGKVNAQNAHIISHERTDQWKEAVRLASGMSAILQAHAGEFLEG